MAGQEFPRGKLGLVPRRFFPVLRRIGPAAFVAYAYLARKAFAETEWDGLDCPEGWAQTEPLAPKQIYGETGMR